ncbi:ROK family protein [Streptomyces sp. M19]
MRRAGCLEAYVGARAVLARFRQARRGRPAPGDSAETSFAALVAAADTSPAARRVLEEATVYLGAGIANLVNLLNPQRVMLGGWAGLLLGARMLPRLRESAAAHALRRPFARTEIGLCRLGPRPSPSAPRPSRSAATSPTAARRPTPSPRPRAATAPHRQRGGTGRTTGRSRRPRTSPGRHRAARPHRKADPP